MVDVGATSEQAPSNTALVRRIPWDKILLWAPFFAALYVLRSLILLIFMTVLLSYFVRRLVEAMQGRLPRDVHGVWIDRLLTLAAFAIITLVLFMIGSLLGPKLYQQGQTLLIRMQQLRPEQAFDSLLSNTVGSLSFWEHYGKPGEKRYEEALAEFQKDDQLGLGAYRSFGSQLSAVQADFETTYHDATLKSLRTEMASGGKSSASFDQWLANTVAPKLLAAKRDDYLARWSDKHPERSSSPRVSPTTRDAQIEEAIAQEIKSKPDQLARWKQEWEQQTISRRMRALRSSPAYRKDFETVYEAERRQNPREFPYSFADFEKLEEAYGKGRAAFQKTFQETIADSPDARPLIEADFRQETESRLAQQWWKSNPLAISIQRYLRLDGSKLLGSLGGWSQEALQAAVVLPIELLTAIMLAFFVTLDWKNLVKSVRCLSDSSLRDFYREYAPALSIFCRLLGRTFEVQALVALANSLLSLVTLWLLGVSNLFFLVSLIFVCSLIPVVGILLASIPVTLSATLQTDGSLLLGAEAFIAIAAVQFFEGCFLNPRIVGNLLHLHPVTSVSVLTIGGFLFGVWGILLATPVTVFVIDVVVLRRSIPGITDGAGLEPTATDE
ncbi:hypothetical protein Pan216_38960 [Planctomycetes bacterium Pan216]|uniref:Pheromone autoinducer 2 transporter n=1 Tax=Kolteria novifilia TaxID=2527975 RepID=A0A518B7U4_9BACT|nr:hypothetical protein Pan216_38960 [Planctomycetes bacterium Pan216]